MKHLLLALTFVSTAALASPAYAADAGTDGGNGATTTRPDSGAADTGEEPEDDGCSTSTHGARGTPGTGLVLIAGALGSALIMRRGRRTRETRRRQR